ncbi:hypothetical protein CUC08_Gglean007353 [Alternaria sp. MG1]|nr:hypothetical protein CUC08_Gglean007353 [Alternaria sp. MG1]
MSPHLLVQIRDGYLHQLLTKLCWIEITILPPSNHFMIMRLYLSIVVFDDQANLFGILDLSTLVVCIRVLFCTSLWCVRIRRQLLLRLTVLCGRRAIPVAALSTLLSLLFPLSRLLPLQSVLLGLLFVLLL